MYEIGHVDIVESNCYSGALPAIIKFHSLCKLIIVPYMYITLKPYACVSSSSLFENKARSLILALYQVD